MSSINIFTRSVSTPDILRDLCHHSACCPIRFSTTVRIERLFLIEILLRQNCKFSRKDGSPSHRHVVYFPKMCSYDFWPICSYALLHIIRRTTAMLSEVQKFSDARIVSWTSISFRSTRIYPLSNRVIRPNETSDIVYINKNN